jgi:hypothetical protein
MFLPSKVHQKSQRWVKKYVLIRYPQQEYLEYARVFQEYALLFPHFCPFNAMPHCGHRDAATMQRLHAFKADDQTRFSARDSLGCKYSASRLDYFKDPFIEPIYEGLNRTQPLQPHTHLDTHTPRTHMPHIPHIRRSPIIHRGYFARSEGFAKVLELFLERTSGAPRLRHLAADPVRQGGRETKQL